MNKNLLGIVCHPQQILFCSVLFLYCYTKLKLKMYQIWDGFCAVAKLNGGRRSSATLTGMKQRHGVKDTQR